MAPEQIEGKDVDGRTDIYALGCVLHECLSGTVPHQKDSEVAVIYAHLSEPPPPVSSKRPGLPEALDTVVATAMARDKEDRFDSCEEMVDALRAALEGKRQPGNTVVAPAARRAPATMISPATSPPTSEMPTGPDRSVGATDGGGGTLQERAPATAGAGVVQRSTSRFPWILLGLILLAALVAGGFFLLSGNDETPTRRRSAVGDNNNEANDNGGEQPASGPLQSNGIAASSTAAQGVDAAGNPVSYDAQNAIDGDPTTTWRTDGDGTGESLTLTFDQPIHVTQVGLIPGYAKVDPTDNTDRFFENRRVLSVEYSFDDGTATQSFEEAPELQSIDVDSVTQSITITITSTSEHGGRDFTPISEVEVQGFPE